MKKQKSPRNKTIDFELEEGQKYLDKCIQYSDDNDLKLDEIINKTIIGDTFSVLPNMPKQKVDLLIVDPPYNLTKSYHGNKFSKRQSDEYYEYTKSWLSLCLPLLKEDASIYVCCDWESSLIIGQVLTETVKVQNRITWQREKGRGAKRNWKNGMEDIWFATLCDNYTFNLEDVMIRKKVIAPYRDKGKPKDWTETKMGNFRDTCPSNFWDDITIPFWSMPENTAHPTQKSEKLIAKIILASSNPGDLVFDPFLGSGTTSVVANKLGRQYCGIEQNPLYAAWGQKRIEMALADNTIQGLVNGVFWERNTLTEQQKNEVEVVDSESCESKPTQQTLF